ncbi:GNAT family N-acetyltransferase [Streptomyces ardesiacus]|uniref:GNAT family N-acetyltransferase n=1 Tax=Streptomyces ardesiacus TaxID=285564 RepID=UPI0013C15586|nr:GNAT family N-acetyltransferase [Streptomyces ardesiacus]MCL7365720.1 GNAT family N-acetyltransferase [Streptomyces ardesiacus]NEB60404.1 GNAT family N-acetyltransferase [Streptomyces diastaticus]
MSLVRRAVAEDAEEVLRLRQVMIASVNPDASTDWQAGALPGLRTRLADPDGGFAAFVVDHPERPVAPAALAALVVGTLEYRIGGPDRPGGLLGYVFSVATDPGARRRGYARACMAELLEWFRERGAGHVMLTASPDAEPLYASMGFTRDTTPSMRLYL